MVSVLKRVNLVQYEVYLLVHGMLVGILLREKAPDKVLGLPRLDWRLLLLVSHLPILSSSSYFRVFVNCSIFRSESEAKDDEPQKVVAPDDEVAEGGYYTIPPIQKVASTTSVPNFVVSRKGYGSIAFKSPVDLIGITSLSLLREVIDIKRGQVSVYPDETKCVLEGTGLSVPAEVTLENVRPPANVELEQFINELRSKPNTEFVSYNPESGVWVYNVQHFSVVDI